MVARQVTTQTVDYLGSSGRRARMSTDLRLLSIRQPHAWAICSGHKEVEKRAWRFPTGDALHHRHRGWYTPTLRDLTYQSTCPMTSRSATRYGWSRSSRTMTARSASSPTASCARRGPCRVTAISKSLRTPSVGHGGPAETGRGDASKSPWMRVRRAKQSVSVPVLPHRQGPFGTQE